MKKNQLEIACFNLNSVIIAQQNGADRVELCANMKEGGTTPDFEITQIAREKLTIDLNVMIRPRGGDFVYSDTEFEQMKAEILQFKKLNVDGFVFGILNASLSLEANYYTQSKSGNVIKTSDSYEGSATGKLILDNGSEIKSKLLPFIEASFMEASIGHATINLSSGNPYWMIDNRFYAGGGVGWKFGKEEMDFNFRLEAAWFYDDYSDDFKRFTGSLSYQLFDYTAVTTSFEVYSQSKFYSNAIQFGVKHNLKKKTKK